MKQYDVVIIGGGPAGSTVGTLVKKYAPELRVLLLEKARFPRHHVGESLLAGATPILEEMGVAGAVAEHGFLEKLGATYVWGKDRTLWGFEFDELMAQLVAQGRSLPKTFTRAWQVRRGEYDHLLLLHAASSGVEVREGARVLRVLREGDGPVVDRRVVGVEYRDEHGVHQAASGLVMDCSGQDALLGRELDLREFDEQMNNYALWGYWQGAKWKFKYVGHPRLTRIFLATTPRGWIWYIPVRRDTISVGLVTHRRFLKGLAGGVEQLYREELRGCPEIQGLLDGATLTRIAADQSRDVCAIQDWSYNSRRVAGPGWAMCGDAAGFVDPILSSGVMLAHELGQKAAYTINTVFRTADSAQAERYWSFYERTYHTYLRAYRDMAAFWYSNNFAMQSWWWEAQRQLVQEHDGLQLSSREAFMRLASGYANRAESLSLFGSYPIHEAQRLVGGLFGDANGSSPADAYAGRPLKLGANAALDQGLYYWQGLVRTTRRVVNSGEPERFLDLHPGEEWLLGMLDGSRTIDELNRATGDLKLLEQRMPLRSGTDLVVQLDAIGVLEY